jgi:TRAP transporter TAXI family solute receptor
MRLRSTSRFLRTSAGIAALIVTAAVTLWVLFAALRPLPGRDVTIATGPPGSVYAQSAERYRKILARDGVRLRLVPTKGAVENLELLRDPRSRVEVAFLQAGITSQQESPDLVSLGTMFYEPLWVFCRGSTLVEMLRDLPNVRISVGQPGSGTRPLALQLLALNNVDASKLQLTGYAPEEAARRLIAGELDVAVILAAWESSAVQTLLHAPGIELMSFKRADAYVALDSNFSKLVLPQGVADLATNRPPADVSLIASKASLVVQRGLHTALQYLLLRAAIEVHGRHGIFQRANEFPAPEEVDLPVSGEALHVYKSGPSLLQRTLPFWLAELLERLLIIVLPIVGILYPLWSLLPRFYRWQMQRRIYRLYGELRLIERTLHRSTDSDERARMRARFEDLERRVLELKMPQSFGEMSFNLKMHMRAVRESTHTGA